MLDSKKVLQDNRTTCGCDKEDAGAGLTAPVGVMPSKSVGGDLPSNPKTDPFLIATAYFYRSTEILCKAGDEESKHS